MRKATDYHGVMSIQSTSPNSNRSLHMALLTSFLPFSSSLNPRRAPEEKGSFGKNRNRRLGSTRSRSKTATPARKEDPNKAYEDLIFGQARKEHLELEEAKTRKDTQFTDVSKPQTEKEPTECILYGYKEDIQFKAIWKYEKISQGMICEDYPRTSPFDNPRYPTTLAQRSLAPPRSLTRAEAKKAMRCASGTHWIKVTFEDFESADRACHFSPQKIDGHMVFCELFRGAGPDRDVPILEGSDEANRPRISNTPKSPMTPRLPASPDPRASTFSRSFTSSTLAPSGLRNVFNDPSSPLEESSTTASSATAIAPLDTAPLRQRNATASEPEFMTAIPTVRRAIILPSSTCLAPQPSLAQRILGSIPILNIFQGEMIGLGPAKFDDGELDWDNTNLYWRLMFFIDFLFGKDICGLKADKEEAAQERAALEKAATDNSCK
jgi:hypothetical protein